MKKIKFILVLIIINSFFFGCGAPNSWIIVPGVAKANNPYFRATLLTENVKTLVLKVTNNTDKNIEIVWNRTFYIDPSGGTNGYFTFGKEIHWEEKDNTNPPTVVFPHAFIERTLYPVVNRYWSNGWSWRKLDVGINGVFLSVMVDGKEITEKILFEVKIKE